MRQLFNNLCHYYACVRRGDLLKTRGGQAFTLVTLT